MEGLGFQIWKIANTPVEAAIAALRRAGARWASIKVADGQGKYNQTGGNDKVLLDYIDKLRGAGFEVGGWQYVYADYPGPQGDAAMERIEKLSLDHFFVDVEHEWMQPDMGQEARTYMSKFSKGPTVLFNSYRYPSQHPPLPYAKFMYHEMMDAAAPQVYWLGRHDPRAQILRSLAEYKQINDDKRFVPMGCTFTTGLDGAPGYWEPSCADFIEFVKTCMELKLYTYGFYSLDVVVQKRKFEWLDAIAGVVPEEPVEELPGSFDIVVDVDVLNIREAPTTRSKDCGNVVRGQRLTALNVEGNDAWAKIAPNRYVCIRQGAKQYVKLAPEAQAQ